MRFQLIMVLTVLLSSCGYLKYTVKPSPLSNKIRTDGFYYLSNCCNETPRYTTIYFFYENGNVYRMWSQASMEHNRDSVYQTITRRVENDKGIYRIGELTNWGTSQMDSDTLIIQLRDSGGFMPLITMGSTVKDTLININWLVRKESNWDIPKNKREEIYWSLKFHKFELRPKAVDLSQYTRK